jgi:hypothetical protein
MPWQQVGLGGGGGAPRRPVLAGRDLASGGGSGGGPLVVMVVEAAAVATSFSSILIPCCPFVRPGHISVSSRAPCQIQLDRCLERQYTMAQNTRRLMGSNNVKTPYDSKQWLV